LPFLTYLYFAGPSGPLAQAEGQGISTIYRLLKENGSPAPIFKFGPEHDICTLPAHPRHVKV
jgi:predicted HTH transcriptional regulator